MCEGLKLMICVGILLGEYYQRLSAAVKSVVLTKCEGDSKR